MAFFASLNKLTFISQHPKRTVEYYELDSRLTDCFDDLNLPKAVSCIFMSDDDLLEINQMALQHDYYTDVITFDYSDDPDYTHSELYISLDRVEDNASQYDIDPREELHRVIIHGMLHLAGYNDKTPEQVEKMRSMENRYLDLHRST
jgi:rRNA maturation RNase YbeY